MRETGSAMNRVIDRIDELRLERNIPSERKLAELAGLSKTFFTRLRTRSEEDEKASVEPENATALAKALSTSTEWLLYGKGLRTVADDDDPIPERAAAIRAARELDVPEPAIAKIRAQKPTTRLSKRAWFKRIDALAEEFAPVKNVTKRSKR